MQDKLSKKQRAEMFKATPQGAFDAKKGGKKHVLILTQFYKPEPFIFPPAIAEAQLGEGKNVTVVTGYPNRPGGKLFKGYRQRFGFSELIDGVRVQRTPIVINHSRRSFERILNFLSFSFSALSNTRKIKDADAVYVYATPATAAIPAQIWSRLFGIPYILHVQDLWPESVTDSGMVGNSRISRILEWILNVWLKTLYKGAAKVIAISPGMKQLLIDRGVDSNKVEVLFNWADETTIEQKPAGSFSNGQVNLLYAGNLGQMQDLDTVIEAAKVAEGKAGFHLKIAGGGVLEDALKTQSLEVSSVEFLGRLSRNELSEFYFESDFQLVTLKDIPIFRVNVPSKLQASLAAGVPVITTVKGDVANLIEEYGAGIVAEPENVKSLSDAFKKAASLNSSQISQMGKNARRLYDEKMSKESGLARISSIINEVQN